MSEPAGATPSRAVGRGLGVTVLPEWAQCEGVEAVLDGLQAAGVTMVATSPYVMEPVAEGTGSREPPADGGAGAVRLLDRPLWGERALWVRTAPSFVPDRARYQGLAYRPSEPDDLTRREGAVVARFLAAAKGRGMTTHLQVQSAIPPGYRVQFGGPRRQDEPLGPDGEPVPGRVDANASLASPDILAYGEALLGDLAAQYPEADAIRIDWPEIPPYAFGALFFDFSPHAIRAAEALGVDAERMRADTLALQRDLCALDDATLERADAAALEDAIARYRGVRDLLALRCALVQTLLESYRRALPARVALVAQAFPPPFQRLSGFDVSAAACQADAIGVKLYTMHWPMMLRHWGEALAARAPNASRRAISQALVRLAGTGGPLPEDLDDLVYPPPDAPHPASDEAMAHKVALVRAMAGDTPVAAFAHAYGPTHDVARRLAVAWEASDGHMWVNRYGYLSEEKRAALGEIVR